MFRILAVEFKRNLLSWLIGPMSVAWILLVLLRKGEWAGSWLSANSYTATVTAFMLLPTGAILGLESSRRQCSGLIDYLRSSRRSKALASSLQLLLLTAIAFVPAAVALAVVWASNLPVAPTFELVGIDQIGYAASMIVLTCALSYAAGSVASSPAAGAILGLIVGVIVGFFGDIPLSTSPDIHLATSRMFLAAGVAILSFSAALLFSWWSSVSERQNAVASPRGASVVLVGAGLALTVNAAGVAGDLRVGNDPPVEEACTSSRPKVCVWPDHAYFLPDLEKMAARVAKLEGSGLRTPRSFREFGLDGGRDMTYAFTVQGQHSLPGLASEGFATTVLNSTLLPSYCEPRSQAAANKRSDLESTLKYWLHSRIAGSSEDVPDDGNGQVKGVGDRVLRSSAESQRAWSARTVKAILSIPCGESKS